MARAKSLASMSIDALVRLRDDVGSALSKRAGELRRQLSSLGGSGKRRKPGTDVGNGRRPRKGSKLRGRKVAPKYRHPKTGETWSGRGAMAGWLKAELKAGKKRDSFLIGGKKPRRKTRR
jgi:DNA-binding protein H-NS